MYIYKYIHFYTSKFAFKNTIDPDNTCEGDRILTRISKMSVPNSNLRTSARPE